MARLRSGIVNLRSSALGSTVIVSDSGEQFLELLPCLPVHRAPVEFAAPDLDHRLQRRDRDALGAVEAATRTQHVAGTIPQMVRERVLGLARQRDAVDEEQHAGDDARFEQPFDEGCRRARLAGSCRHFDQQLAPSARDLSEKRLDAFDLVVAVDNPAVGGNPRQVAPDPARGDPPLQVVLGKEARDLARVGVGLPVEEPHFLAVRQEDERHAELFGVVPSWSCALIGSVLARLASSAAMGRPCRSQST